MELTQSPAQLNALADLLSDESRLTGEAQAVLQPRDESELQALLVECYKQKIKVTVSSGLTGISGGAVPCGGVAVNLKKMNKILGLRKQGDDWLVRCQPGVSLADLRLCLLKKDFSDSADWNDADKDTLCEFGEADEYVFPVDPTETSACLGGMVACNASGARSFYYGAMRNYLQGMRALMVDGRALSLRRGEQVAEGRNFNLQLDNGTVISGTLPGYELPEVKNAAGYFAAANMDLLDLFVGSEGTLAVFSELELKLVPAPESLLGVVFFTKAESSALDLVDRLKREDALQATNCLAIEFFGSHTLAMLKKQKETCPDEIPELPAGADTALYVEFAGTTDAVDDAMMFLAEILEEAGVEDEATWIATEEREHEKLKLFRHAVPETVNQRIGTLKRNFPQLTKLGTDMAVRPEHLREMLGIYRDTLDKAKLEYVIFGHIGSDHLHVNILPHSEAEYQKGKEIYQEFARQAIAFGGTVSAEHGLGKLKAFLLPVMYGEEGVGEMRELKKCFDPDGMLNCNTLFELTVKLRAAALKEV